MNYLLDTNHWSYLQRRHAVALARLQSLPEDTMLYMPVVAQAELLARGELTADGRRKQELYELYRPPVAEATQILPLESRASATALQETDPAGTLTVC